VREVVILDLHREPLGRRVERRSLRHRPREHHAAQLKAQVEVAAARGVLLHDEHARADAANRELLVALDARVGDLDAADRRPARTRA
jgi:hypothetical protein